MLHRPQQKSYSSENELIEEYAIEHEVIVKFKDIPLIVKGAFIIAEDREFYTHSGISIQNSTCNYGKHSKKILG